MSTYIDLSPDKGIICIPLVDFIQRTATVADVATAIVPCKGRVVAISGWVGTIGGTTDPTDVDLMVEKGTTDLHTLIPAVNSSTDAGPLMATLVTTAASLAVAAGDILHLDITVTGGTSPTIDGIGAHVFIARE